MDFTRERTIDGALSEWDDFGKLVRSLSPEDWDSPTRCEGWQVRDVANHVVGTVAEVAAGTVGSKTPEEEAAERRGHSPDDTAAELETSLAAVQPLIEATDDAAWDGPSMVPELTIRQGVATLWYDTFVHADDIRAALGLPSQVGPGLEASVAYVAWQLEEQGWGPATLALDGTDQYEIGGGGEKVEGDPLTFVLAATGRTDPVQLGLGETVNLYREG